VTNPYTVTASSATASAPGPRAGAP